MADSDYEADRSRVSENGSTLRRRIGELEQQVSELQAELARTRSAFPRRINWRAAIAAMLPLAGAAATAAIPPGLVFLDRWLKQGASLQPFHRFWCSGGPFCPLALPPYFFLAIASLMILPLWVVLRKASPLLAPVVAVRERVADTSGAVAPGQARLSLILRLGSLAAFVLIAIRALATRAALGWSLALMCLVYAAGWFLAEIPGERIAGAWRRHGRWLTGYSLLILSLVGGLASLYAAPRFQWAFALLVLLAAVNLRQVYRQVPVILWVVALAMVLYALNSNAWWLSSIGDEYAFFYAARTIAETQGLDQIGSQLFNGQAVYGAHPYLSSLLQAVFVKLLGSNSFGWRFSNAALSALAVGLLYGFYRLFVSERTALVAALLLAFSHYIMSFGKIGYNNLQALLAMALALWAAVWAIRSSRPLAFVVLGGTLGFCFYVYPAALYVLPIPLLLLLFFQPPTSRAVLARWGLMLFSLFILFFPLLLQKDYWTAKVAGTFFYNPRLVQAGEGLVAHLARNVVYAFFSFLYIAEEGHFVVASYVDPLTGAVACLGLACVVVWLRPSADGGRRGRLAAFLLLSLAALIFLVGATHDRAFPPNTRMFLLLPWLMLFAAIGLEWWLEQARALGGRIEIVRSVSLLAALALNLYQAYPLARDRLAGLQTFEALVNRLIQNAQRDENQNPKTYAIITDPSWSSIGIQQVPTIYPVRARVVDVVVTASVLPEAARPLIADRNTLVIIKPWMAQAQQQAFEPALRGLGKAPCPIKTTTGDVRFTLWHAADLAWLCR